MVQPQRPETHLDMLRAGVRAAHHRAEPASLHSRNDNIGEATVNSRVCQLHAKRSLCLHCISAGAVHERLHTASMPASRQWLREPHAFS